MTKKVLVKTAVIVLIVALCACLAGCGVSDNTLEEAMQHEAEGNFKKALQVYKTMLRDDPVNYEALYGRANAYFSLGDNEKAIDAYEELFELCSWSVYDEHAWNNYCFINNTETTWSDPVIEAKVREYLGFDEQHVITSSDLIGITQIEILGEDWFFNASYIYDGADEPNYYGSELQGMGGITSLHDFANFPALETLAVKYNRITVIDVALAQLFRLSKLELNGNYLFNIDAVADMRMLTELNISDNAVRDISALTDLVLSKLYMDNNLISDLTPLTGLIYLQELSLDDNFADDFSPIAGMTELTLFSACDSNLTSVDFLSGMTAMQTLKLSKNDLSDLTPLSGMYSLTELRLDNNASLTDLTPIAGASLLEELWLLNTPADGYSVAYGMPQLNTLSFDYGEDW